MAAHVRRRRLIGGIIGRPRACLDGGIINKIIEWCCVCDARCYSGCQYVLQVRPASPGQAVVAADAILRRGASSCGETSGRPHTAHRRHCRQRARVAVFLRVCGLWAGLI